MKNYFSILVLLAFITLPLAAQERVVGLENFESLKILDMELPTYPNKMVFQGIYDGQATLVISVDETGSITDVFQESYTHPIFGRLADESVRKWTFQPAKLNGEPVPSIKPVNFNFDDRGGVYSVGIHEAASSSLMFTSSPNSKRVYNLKELDELLEPELMVQPYYPEEFRDRGIDGSATVLFYIDEAGSTRMAHLEGYTHSSFGTSAISAVINWKFKAPTVKGKPATIQVRQTFNFTESSK